MNQEQIKFELSQSQEFWNIVTEDVMIFQGGWNILILLFKK